MDERPSKTTTDRTGRLRRRRFLLAAALAGVSGFAGCSTSDDGTTETGEQTTTDTTDTTRVKHTTDLEPPDEKRPLAEKYPGLRVLDRWRAGEADSRDVYTQYLTPLDSFYVVSHFQTPVLDADEHTVTIIGGDGTTIDVEMAAIQIDYSTEAITHTMQCAGNGRKYFAEMNGWAFDYGAAGTAQWTGTPISEVFEAHDVTIADDAWVMAAGADGPANDADRVFARSIPASKLLDDCLLVYQMNGEPLPLEHGFPVRLLVPGWYGTNSVKWLSKLRVMDGMVRGGRWQEYSEWQQHHYRILPEGVEENVHATIDTLDTWEQIEAKTAGKVEYYPYVYDMTVKSLISYPGESATVAPRNADGKVEVLGVAWAGDDHVDRVEVSTDGGETWHRAKFLGPDRGSAAWRRFRYLWDANSGEYTLYSRATDEKGRTQPREIAAPGSGLDATRNDEYPWNRGGYASNAYRELGVNVRVE